MSSAALGLRRPPVAIWLIGLVVLAVLAVASLFIGSQGVSPGTVVASITAFDVADPEQVAVRLLRVPRTFVGILAGAALGAAGSLIQAITRNPLAEPGLLGVNSGAAAVVATGILAFGEVSITGLLGLAFLGGAVAGVAVLLLGGAFRATADPVRLVLAGAAMSVAVGSFVIALLVSYPARFATFRNWDAGAVLPRPWELIGIAALLTLIGAVAALAISRSLDALALGTLGRAFGASVRRTWIVSGVAIVILCGTATALTGPIAFLGLVAPVLGRRLVGPSYAFLLPTAMILGADLLLVSDIIGRVVVGAGEVQAAIVMALIGGPVFVAVARRKRMVSL
ncbi:MAG: iron ABC transporter permease [Micropruina sp.]|uniref:FecCD family ABC transporter permease n=1 Tax=Micropruina sp. TaxID=2737536 RepID=UPI0039E42DA1